MKRVAILLLISRYVLVPLSAGAITSTEETYIKTRDGYIHQFGNVPSEKIDHPRTIAEMNYVDPARMKLEEHALSVLEAQIRMIIGHVNYFEESVKPRFTLNGFEQEGICCSVDGLLFERDKDCLFVTTDSLMDNYLSRFKELPRSIPELAKFGEIYTATVRFDSAVTSYTEIPVNKVKGQLFAYAFLGVNSQDIGPYIPQTIYVFISTGERIYIATSESKVEITDIDECKKLWDDHSVKSEKLFQAYRESNLKDTKSFDEHIKLDEESFPVYYKCFGKNIKSKSVFGSLKSQAQSIVDRLSK